jgi:hypothetical protein
MYSIADTLSPPQFILSGHWHSRGDWQFVQRVLIDIKLICLSQRYPKNLRDQEISTKINTSYKNKIPYLDSFLKN